MIHSLQPVSYNLSSLICAVAEELAEKKQYPAMEYIFPGGKCFKFEEWISTTAKRRVINPCIFIP